MHGSALGGVNFMPVSILCITSAHLFPEDFNPYKGLRKSEYALQVPQILGQQLCRALHQ